MLPWAILVNWRPKNGILRFLLSETSLTLSEKNSGGTETAACYIPTGNYWEGITASRYFSSELVCASLSQTAPQTVCYFTCPCTMCWFVFFPPFPQSFKGLILLYWGWTTRALPDWWSSAWPRSSWCPTSREGASDVPLPWAATLCRCSMDVCWKKCFACTCPTSVPVEDMSN